MRGLLLALTLALAGCSSSPAAGPVVDAGPPPAGETWYFDVQEGVGRVLTQDKPEETWVSGDAVPTVGETRLGPYEADDATAGFPAGAAALAILPFQCQHPADVRLRVEVRADGAPVGEGESVTRYPGSGLVGDPVEAVVAFGLSAAVPPGAALSADIVHEGCASLMMGRGGDWARSLALGAAAADGTA